MGNLFHIICVLFLTISIINTNGYGLFKFLFNQNPITMKSSFNEGLSEIETDVAEMVSNRCVKRVANYLFDFLETEDVPFLLRQLAIKKQAIDSNSAISEVDREDQLYANERLTQLLNELQGLSKPTTEEKELLNHVET